MDDKNNSSKESVTPVDSYDPLAAEVSAKLDSIDSVSGGDVSVSSDHSGEADSSVDPAAAMSNQVPVAPVVTAPVGVKPKSKMPMGAVIGIIAGAIVLLFGGSALAYNLYYQNPQKVVADSLANMLKAETVKYTAQLDSKTDDYSLKVELSGASTKVAGSAEAKIIMKVQGQEYSVNAAGIVDDKSDIYFKVSNIAKIVNEFSALIPGDSKAIVDKIVAKIDDQWIKFSSDDMKKMDEDLSKSQVCMTDVIKKFQTDKKSGDEIARLYRDNQFIVVSEKLGSRDGSLGYLLAGDKAASKKFMAGLKETSVYRDLSKCDGFSEAIESDDLTDEGGDVDDARIELWVDRWTHQVTRLTVADKDAATRVTFSPVFNTRVSVDTPKDSITVDELSDDMSDLMTEYIGGSSATPYGGIGGLDSTFEYDY